MFLNSEKYNIWRMNSRQKEHIWILSKWIHHIPIAAMLDIPCKEYDGVFRNVSSDLVSFFYCDHALILVKNL